MKKNEKQIEKELLKKVVTLKEGNKNVVATSLFKRNDAFILLVAFADQNISIVFTPNVDLRIREQIINELNCIMSSININKEFKIVA